MRTRSRRTKSEKQAKKSTQKQIETIKKADRKHFPDQKKNTVAYDSRVSKKNYISDDERQKNLAVFMDGSAVKNEDGSPMVVYTGTSKDKDFTSFNVPRNGAWFSSNRDEASSYAIQNDSQKLVYEYILS